MNLQCKDVYYCLLQQSSTVISDSQFYIFWPWKHFVDFLFVVLDAYISECLIIFNYKIEF